MSDDESVFWCIRSADDGDFLSNIKDHSFTSYASHRTRYSTKASALSALWRLRDDRRGMGETFRLVRIRAVGRRS